MAAEIVQIDPQDLTSQIYESQDTNLIPTFDINTSLTSTSYIEYFVYDLNQNILSTEYNFVNYKVLNDGQAAGTGVLSQIEIDPEKNLIDLGYNQGTYSSYYNFLDKKIGSNSQQLYITEISSDRTEIRLDSTVLTNDDIIGQTTAFVNERENSDYFLDFYLNFGDNTLCIANNIALDDQDPNNPTILIKLYEPLPDQFDINSTLWVVTSVEEPIAYQVNFIEEPIVFDDTIKIKGPNFNIELKDQVNNSTQELSYVDLITTSLTSSQNQLNSLLEEKEIDINIDWTNFEDFIHFSSAQTRLENFYYKVSLIEQYSSSISIIESNITGSTSASLAVSESKTALESKINNIITNFDGWDYYLYYSSGSWAWPKLNSEPPYQLASTGSVDVLNWIGSTNPYSPQYGGIILSASLYDENNKDNLLFSIPEYLREDSDNAPYELFIDMVAQHFDNIWIYYKDVTQKFNADNRLESGISKDIVADAIRDFGIKLYQNNFSNQDLYTAFLGLTPEGGLFPFPNITGSLPTPSGFEYVDTLISASNDYIPLDDVNKSLYKRIYHNLPYLLKSKGTLPGLRALITSYGIPDTVLRIKEYGGKDKVDSNDWDYWQNEFNYAYSTEADNFISSSWSLNSDWNSPDDVPSTLAFRFKTPGLPQSNIRYSQSLWSNDAGSAIVLTYTGSAYVSGSYSGSIIDPYYQYATLTFYPDITEPTTSSNIYLPFFDGGWWSVMVNRSGSNFTLSAADKIYEGGNNGTILGFYETSSVTGDPIPWVNSIYSYFPISFSVGTIGSYYDVVTYDNTAIYDNTGSLVGTYTPFSGSYQEIRYYSTAIHPNVFKDYTMNPYSIEGNSLNNSPNELAFRASLGGEFYTSSVSIHPKITGSWITTHSFANNSSFYYDLTPIFIPNIEYFFFDQPVAGIKNAVSDKIRLENDNIPSGSVLSPFRRLAQTTEASASYTPNINLLEVAFSPQDEINDDINSSIGFFNIGNFIGDPAFRSSRLTSYPDLDQLRNEYFEKYTKNYNLVDFIRLIKFFDNSLFKMIRDFVPARTSLASGIVVKQTLLERNRYPQPQADNHTTIAKYGRSGSIVWNEPIIVQDITITGSVNPQWNDYNPGTIENFSGGTAGMFEPFNGVDTSPYGADGNGPDNRFGITQSWNETYPTLSGSVTIVHDSQDEFYNGEFFGSTIIVTTQSLNLPYPVNYTTFNYKPTHYYQTSAAIEGLDPFNENEWLDYFLSPVTSPSPGEIYLYDKKIGSTFTTYIKIAKTDCDGNNNTSILENTNNIFIYNTILSTYYEYKVTLFGEGVDFILYKCEEPLQQFSEIAFPNQVLNYYFSASNPATQSISGTTLGFNPIDTWGSISGNTLNYFNTSSGNYTLQNTPNTRLLITASLTVSGSPGIGGSDMVLRSFNPQTGTFTLIESKSLSGGSNVTRTITASYYALSEDKIYISIRNILGGDFTIKSGSFLLTQSRAIENVSCSPIAFFEPNITEANFYNSDENAIINNAIDNRQSSLYQDMDYTQGALVPVNFESLLSGSATRAMVQDSNYSLQRHINPRYNGSRTTSQQLNVWTDGDVNTFGKLSTIDTAYSLIAYCDYDGGYPPEHMNAVGAKIKYIIDQNFTSASPNLTPESIKDIQNSFRTNELVQLDYTTDNNASSLKRIIRGGYRIEPIFYNQTAHYLQPAGVNTFTGSIEITSISNNNSLIIPNYTLTKSPIAGVANATTYPYNQVIGLSNEFSGLNFYQVISAGSALTSAEIGTTATTAGNRFTITSTLLNSGISSLTFKAVVRLQKSGDNDPYVQIAIRKNRSGVITNEALSPSQVLSSYNILTAEVSIPITNLQVGDYFTVDRIANGNGTAIFFTDVSFFTVSQTPYPTPPLSISGSGGDLFFTSSLNSNTIYSTSSQFIEYYGNTDIRQKDISGSGFFPIKYPIEFFPGDEIRFEGNEDYVYMVKGVSKSSGSFSFATSSINIELDKPISGSNLNINQFLVRRYVEDGSIIIFESINGDNGDGTLFARPQYVTNELNTSINTLLSKLSSDNLI